MNTEEIKNAIRRMKQEDAQRLELGFLQIQFKEIQEGGWESALSKIGEFILALLFLPLIIVVRVMQPFILVRFGQFRSDRLGHFATNTAMYMCRREKNGSRKTFDFFYHKRNISNQQMKKMWDRTLRVWEGIRYLDKANRLVPGWKNHRIKEEITIGRDKLGLYDSCPVPVFFTPQEEQVGEEALRRMGIPKGASFVCFHVRTKDYLADTYQKMDFSYHRHRDATVNNFTSALLELMSRGYYVIRMGACEKERLKIEHPFFIDYAIDYRTDFLDIYLGAKCYFFFGTTGGITSIPRLFKRPIAWTDFIPLENFHTWDKNSLFIPKKLWSKDEKRLLTFSEILQSHLGRLTHSRHYKTLGINPIENTPEEMVELIIEMDERLKETLSSSDEEEDLQKQFWSLFEKNHLNEVFRARIGTEFLKKNRELLGKN